MRRLGLMLLMLAAPRLAATECITIYWWGAEFFRGAEAIYFGVAHDRWTMRVESVVRGDQPIGALVTVPEHACSILIEGRRYLVVRRCAEGQHCLSWTEDREAPRLLEFLEKAHPETHFSIMKRFITFVRENESLDEMRAWIETVSIGAAQSDENEVALDLVRELRRQLSELVRIQKLDALTAQELRRDWEAVLPLMEKFPTEPAEELDAAVDADDTKVWETEGPHYYDEFATELMKKLESVAESERWREAVTKTLPVK